MYNMPHLPSPPPPTHPPTVKYLPAVSGPGADPRVSDPCRHVATSHFPPSLLHLRDTQIN